jgi:magnesium transporter
MATPVRSERFLVTVHREDCPALTEIRRRYRKRERSIDQPSLLLHRVVDGLVDSFFPSLAELDDRIDELEDAIFLKADETQLQEIFR